LFIVPNISIVSFDVGMESGGRPYKRRWFFWLGIALLAISGIFLILLIRYFIESKPSTGDFIFLVILFVIIPAGPGICLLKRASSKPVQKKVTPIPSSLISKKFYFGTTLGAAILLIVGGTLSVWVLRMIPAGPLGSAIFVFGFFGGSCLSIYIAVVFFILLYKAWNSLRECHPRTTPGKAVGFLFIPFLNLYWVFQSVRGFVFDYNTYMAQSERKDFYLGSHLFTSFAILFVLAFAMWFVPVPFLNAILAVIVYVVVLVFTSLVIGKLCDAINHINEMKFTETSLPSVNTIPENI
jgi:hypothetical protein